MPKQIVGSVHWIENGRQTSRLVDVQEAFNDPAQARDKFFLQKLRATKSRSGSRGWLTVNSRG